MLLGLVVADVVKYALEGRPVRAFALIGAAVLLWIERRTITNPERGE